jgi:hypothetical protein
MAAPPSPSPVTRRTIGTFDTYRDAERAVDYLSDRGFAVRHLAIVGTGLRYVEQIGGRVTTARAALTGAAQGAVLGLLFAGLFGIFFTYDNAGFAGVVAYGLGMGVLFGALVGAILHAAQGGRRDFRSVAGTQAERYDVQADESVADEAARLLAALP